MAKRRRYLIATMPDGYVKRIGPTDAPFTHYWRIVAHIGDGGTEVFWGHSKSLREATSKKAATADAARQRGWTRYDFEVVELTEEAAAPRADP
ncbi:hypothetical protein [Sphingomonas sanxanigenens]|uniref:Uncharacterized protein n=1 Tax=Sphingomonas sanxanigenens DSM 19645 = NX02 TaxID=1123269 RepID=W0AAW8_9SPHN|nr:hypothetical protein [Sphingomonas sanxanigenens]AHE53463.1 hypothetical protein NX02_08700 [Sphingomonas sanxanigenens DSM 19645 = NX02]